MIINQGIEENLRFLIIEVQKQVERTAVYLRSPSFELLDEILTRDDYIDNQKSVIQKKCFQGAADDASTIDALKSIEIIAVNLEKIGDFCEKVVRQLTYLEEERFLELFDFEPLFNDINDGIDNIPAAIFEKDIHVALAICRAEQSIDDKYVVIFQAIMKMLKGGHNAQNLITVLFIARYLERIGDSLLNIGEAAASAYLGQTIKIGQMQSLQNSLQKTNSGSEISDLSLESMGETKSGCRIDLVTETRSNTDATMFIFKEGRRKKMTQEKTGVELWDTLIPGIAPRIHASHQNGDSSAILFEYLNGVTLEKLILDGATPLLDEAVHALCDTLCMVWSRTLRRPTKTGAFTRQIGERIESVYDVHPDFASQSQGMGDLELRSFDEQISCANAIEESLTPPPEVLSHGDFNIDNILFDTSDRKIRFIDLHRTGMRDYMQDISVFIVSNHRLRVSVPGQRDAVNRTVESFRSCTSAYAKSIDDRSFEMRLALGLARSYFTSTRFVLNKPFARDMLLRSRYLLERVIEHGPDKPQKFKIPQEIFIV
ncbi:MAG TPA: hypothetical protein ENI69_10245 [Rhodospirillales bacterium]|nr:hypothetical protein [Rhodospirillales bacterium]